jgi:hypothetical protein
MNPGGVTYLTRRLFASPNKAFHQSSVKTESAAEYLRWAITSQEALAMVREALTALALAVFVSGTLGAIIYLGANALMDFFFS